MPPGRLLDIRDLWKAYDGRPAVRGLTLGVEPGEIVGLVGPNGAGKTTTLRVLMGLVDRDGGSVAVHGVPVERGSYEYKALVGYLPEAPALPEYLNPWEFLGYVARLRGVPPGEIGERVPAAIATFGLAHHRDLTLASLSKGLRQRVAIASSLIHNPSLLVWDEPFLGIDPAGQHQVKDLLRDYVGEGHGALVSTHVLDSAERLCHRVVILQEGRVVAQGDLGDLRARAALGQGSSLEEVFLKLTGEETVEGGIPMEAGARWWRRK